MLSDGALGLVRAPFHPGPHHHERSLEFVTGIGREPAEAGETLLQPGQHPVHLEGQPGQLVARPGHHQPAMQAATIADRLQFIHHVLDRPQRAVGQPVADADRRQQDDRQDDHHRTDELPGLERGHQRRGGDQHPADVGHRGNRGGEIAVGAEVGIQVDGAGYPGAGPRAQQAHQAFQ
jgi:hypothetical protein